MFGCTNSSLAALFERFTMTRPSSSSGAEKTTSVAGPNASMMQTPLKQRLAMPPSPATKPHRDTSNREQQRRKFLNHLAQWSLSHDSSLHFHGKISLTLQSTSRSGDLELGKAVKCVLTDTAFDDARQKIVIKLFPPQSLAKKLGGSMKWDDRRDSMDLDGVEVSSYLPSTRTRDTRYQHATAKAEGHYNMVVRYGAGWMPAREYFNKVYCSHLEGGHLTQDEYLLHRSQALGPRPADKDSVTIRPLFHSFRRLPLELQEMILMTAAGLSRTYNLCSDDYGIVRVKKDDCQSAISLSTLFRISKRMNEPLLPYIYHRTDFHFGLTGYAKYPTLFNCVTNMNPSFTNFLWQSGPANRHEIRRLTFHFGKLALLHCIRWLAPDIIFSLFEPPVATNPRSLQYFWRCQIQDLVKDLDLFTLTLNIKQISPAEIIMIVAIMKNAFGSIAKIRFVETDIAGVTTPVEMSDERLKGLYEQHTWKDMCISYYQTHRNYSYFYKFELLKGSEEMLEMLMANLGSFFNTPFSPMAEKETFPAAE
jgi:hypothetical protein